ncbi:hypothetical protein IAQ61_007493, partial [Plenodomus lingam]|uniref:uncharacterized protein n=1 Tax=Leptosphaeria maculans TaxID=5022 RepID=UPI0033223260
LSVARLVAAIHASWELIDLSDKALTLDGNRDQSFALVFRAHLDWFFKKGAVERLRASLSVARIYMNGYFTIVEIQKLIQLKEVLIRALRVSALRQQYKTKFDMRLEDKLESVIQDLYDKTTVYDATDRIMKSARRKLAMAEQKSLRNQSNSQTELLLAFTESVEKCARNIIPASKSRKRTRSATPSVASRTTSYDTDSNARPSPASSRKAANIPRTMTSQSGIRTNSKSQPGPHLDPRTVKVSLNPSQTKLPQKEAVILSPRTIRTESALDFRIITEKVGRHTISMYPQAVKFNDHYFDVANGKHVRTFYQALRKNVDRLDGLDRALKSYCGEEGEWNELPGWRIQLQGWKAAVIVEGDLGRLKEASNCAPSPGVLASSSKYLCFEENIPLQIQGSRASHNCTKIIRTCPKTFYRYFDGYKLLETAWFDFTTFLYNHVFRADSIVFFLGDKSESLMNRNLRLSLDLVQNPAMSLSLHLRNMHNPVSRFQKQWYSIEY